MRSIRTRGSRGTKGSVACDSPSSRTDYFLKDGRRIQVGDCALFKSSGDAPHFVGLIRWLSSNKEENLILCVNKLYRPIELKLGKGFLLDAVPNEVFYSFHRHEIPAASLLHPCKVAFLPKGVELPKGRSSFVCRRVFDTGSKSLQWLTNRDYVDERQDEVDQLLDKTRMEMQATIHSDVRSPKAINGLKPASQFNSDSDNGQTAISIPSQGKGKKRDREDHDSEPIRRERSLKADDFDSARYKSESILKVEISKITEKGGLIDSVGVEKLVQLMQANRVEKKLELISRSMFAGVIAATENFDCLSRFVQLKGLPVLDQWLQEIHKGKVGDRSPKDGDKSVEEFLFVLLRALDKLPVNLQALQMCNIGKSVNHLRTYKNSEIQKKARSLVDTWKKRVEAEMNVTDTKSGSNQAGSWPSKSRPPESSHGGNRQYGGPYEAAKISPTKIASNKSVQAEMSSKLGSSSPGPTKVVSSPLSRKDGPPRSVVGSNPDLPPTTVRDERSSSSNQSHNSQSSSSDHAKTTGVSGKEDARSSTAGSIRVTKVSVAGSTPRRSVTGHPESAPSASLLETGSTINSSLHRNVASEKLSQSGLTCEKKLNLPTVDGSSIKLIVKIPSRGRAPPQSASVGPVEEPTIIHSKATSTVLSEKNDKSDSDSKGSADVKTESWQSNDFKDILTCSDDDDESPEAISKGCDDDAKLAEVPVVVSHSLGNELKVGKLHDVSYSSINALIESCVNTSTSGGDDGAINLLATVAAGEVSKSAMPSPDGCPGTTSIPDESGMGDDSRSKAPDGDGKYQSEDVQYQSEDGLHNPTKQGKSISAIHQQTEGGKTHSSYKLNSETTVNLGRQIIDRSDEVKDIASIATSPACAAGQILMVDERKDIDNVTKAEAAKWMNNSVLVHDKVDDVALYPEVKREASVGVPSNTLLDAADSEIKVDAREVNKANKRDYREGCHSLSKEDLLKCAEKLECVTLEDKKIENGVGKGSIGHETSNSSSSTEDHGDRMTCDVEDESRESESSATNADVETSHVNKKRKFDLNEGFSSDDWKLGNPMYLEDTGFPVFAHRGNPLPFPVASVSTGFPASVTVASAAKGPFVPPMDLLRSKRELGWKGSAATSAFRPAEPRKALEMPSGITRTPDSVTSKQSRPVFDFDLNVADERIFEDVPFRNSALETSTCSQASILDFLPKKSPNPPTLSCSVGLDLNRVDEAGDVWQGSASNGHGLEVPLFPAKTSLLSFDLNNGPILDEAIGSSLYNKHMRTNMQSQPFFQGLRPSTEGSGTFSSWLPAGNAFPPVTVPTILSDNAPPIGPISFSPDLYGGSVSSPAVPFPPFQYPVFPFGTGFPLLSASLSGVSNTYTDPLANGRLGFAAPNAQLLSAPPTLTSHFPRPYVVSRPDSGNNSIWAREGLDLNAGPETLEMEGRDESSHLVSRQLSIARSQALADEQRMMFPSVAGSVVKSKENTDKFRYKQPSWQ